MYYYVHGYLSSPDSTKGNILNNELGVIPIKYRDCKPEDLVISDCISEINNYIKDDENPVLIGSSLGGFLSSKVALNNPKIKKLVLFNPAIIPKDYDVAKILGMPQSILQDMVEPNFFTNKISADILILIGTRDDVVPNSWVKNFAEVQNAKIISLDDDHSLSKSIHSLPSIVEEFLKKD